MQKYLIKSALVVNEGSIRNADVLISNGHIEKVQSRITEIDTNVIEINAEGKYLLPGCIDDQVHFREPGLTHKATIYTESKAAVAGGVTSFMEMPNTVPNALTVELLNDKYNIAAASSLANYSFFMGTSNDNADEVLKMNARKKDVCGVKIFMGASTGNMLVDRHTTLDKIFRESEMLIATHCEDERIIKMNYEKLKKEKGELAASDHPLIRNEEACFESSLTAIQFAKKYNSRLHILHISTEKELQLFSNMLPLKEKRITSEPKREMSKRLAPAAINSIAQQARPIGMGQREFFRNQFRAASKRVTTTSPSTPASPSAAVLTPSIPPTSSSGTSPPSAATTRSPSTTPTGTFR